MIVRQFINWIRTALPGERAEATRALARAWLISDLSEEDRIAAGGTGNRKARAAVLSDSFFQCCYFRPEYEHPHQTDVYRVIGDCAYPGGDVSYQTTTGSTYC